MIQLASLSQANLKKNDPEYLSLTGKVSVDIQMVEQ